MYFLWVLSLAALALSSLYSYLLFHTLAEMVSILIAMTYAVISWHTRSTSIDGSISALGVVYFFVAFLDIFHALAYFGMGIFTGYAFPANQVWVLARVLEAVALLSIGFVDAAKRTPLAVLVIVCAAYSSLGLASIFVFRVFPACFVVGKGQTAFKVASEIFIIVALAAAFVRFQSRRAKYMPKVYRQILASIALTILSELCFMTYLSNFDLLNMAGHLLKIGSFWCIYRAVIVTCLERPNEMLFGKLNDTLVELEASNAAKNDFIAILGHDLRNPLSGISGIAEYLVQGDQAAKPVSGNELMVIHAEIAKSADRALDLIERVLTWARSQSGALKPDIEELDAHMVLEEAMASVSDMAKEKAIEITQASAVGLTIRADREMLATILRNLLTNAIKFTARGGKAGIEIHGGPRVAVLEIFDEGRGMDTLEAERIFKVSGKTIHVGTEGEKGTGFGLALCMEFAEKMGCGLSVSSVPGKGSTFRLEFPDDASPVHHGRA